MKIALAQQSYSENMGANIKKAIDALIAASQKGASIICYPEIQLSPFFPQHPNRNVTKYEITLDHPFLTQLKEKCLENNIGFP